MGEIRIEGQGPFHFPDIPERKVKPVKSINPTRRVVDEYASHEPDEGIHKTTSSGDRLDISKAALERSVDQDNLQTE